jgi:E3 ubiquitin-protein ligase HUWE1
VLQVFKGQQSVMNNMVKVLLKKGLVADLARVPHSLDLSSPRTANTVNAALKPLETLSRIVNQPQTVSSKITKHRNSALNATDSQNASQLDNMEPSQSKECLNSC